MKEQDAKAANAHQLVLYVERDDASYGPVQTGSYLAQEFIDDFFEKRERYRRDCLRRLEAGEISAGGVLFPDPGAGGGRPRRARRGQPPRRAAAPHPGGLRGGRPAARVPLCRGLRRPAGESVPGDRRAGRAGRGPAGAHGERAADEDPRRGARPGCTLPQPPPLKGGARVSKPSSSRGRAGWGWNDDNPVHAQDGGPLRVGRRDRAVERRRHGRHRVARLRDQRGDLLRVPQRSDAPLPDDRAEEQARADPAEDPEAPRRDPPRR